MAKYSNKEIGLEMKKSKFDYEVEAFESAFKEMKESKIAIYGTGRMTATLLSRLKGFHIVGLLDRDINMIGKEMYGVKIISREEAERTADFIVINTSETYWNTIYQRISDWEIPIYFRNGERALKDFCLEHSEEAYWEKNYTELWKKVQNYEVISFDIFDTLVMRKVYSLIDIFYIIEKNFRRELENGFSFVEVRKKVTGLLENATIDEIYAELRKLEGWDDGLTERIKQYEIEVENQMIVPRRDMVKLYNELKKTKEIYLVSDMYLPSAVLQKILLRCGIIIEQEKIIVSCDVKKSKADGTLWEYYKNIILNGRRAIHIGDNERADCELPKQYDIDTYEIWNADKMLQRSSIGSIASDISTLYSSFYIGILNTKIFNSPFALHGTNGKVFFTKEQDAGYCLLRSIKYRYSKEQIKALNKIAWWNWTDEKIREHYDDFYLDIEEFIHKFL